MSAIDLTAMADTHHQDHQCAALPSNSPLRAELAAGVSQRRSIASTTRTRSALGSAVSALAAERLLLSDQHPQRAALLASREACGYAHLSPVEHKVGRVIQGCDPAAQILNVVEVILVRLTDDVGSAAVELLGGSVKLSAEGVGEPGRDLDHRKPATSRRWRRLQSRAGGRVELDPSWQPPILTAQALQAIPERTLMAAAEPLAHVVYFDQYAVAHLRHSSVRSGSASPSHGFASWEGWWCGSGVGGQPCGHPGRGQAVEQAHFWGEGCANDQGCQLLHW